MLMFFFFKQKTAYDMRISDWSSDVCSSDLIDCRETVLEDRFEQSFLGTKMILNGGSVALPRRNRNLPQGNSINSMLAKAIFGCLQDAWRGGDVRALDQGDRSTSHGPSYSQPYDTIGSAS